MDTTATPSREDALRVVRATALPQADGREATRAAPAVAADPPDFDAGKGQVVAVGPQMVEFDAAFPAEMRADVANGFLFAQLAADRAASAPGGAGEADPARWYDTYVETLTHVGWFIERDEVMTREADAGSAQLHQEIIPILSAALGPIGAAALVVRVLEGLKGMNADRPWITLFDRSSQRASAAQFQVGYTTLAQETPSVNLVSFELEASQRVVQVLFFNFAGSDARLRHRATRLTMNTSVFDAVKELIAERVQPFLIGRITDIPIGG